MDFYYKEEQIQLLPEKAAFLPQDEVLLVADVHLGKATHFRKSGIIIPAPGFSQDLRCLQRLIHLLKPKTIVFLGDLFHSEWNREWNILKDFLAKNHSVHFVLIKGNHDILPPCILDEASMEVVDSLKLGKYFLCTHEPLKEIPKGMLNIAGHIHPGVLISSRGRQHYRLPCFYQQNGVLVLPAFGQLTGLHLLKKTVGARVFPVFPSEVIELP